MMMFYVITSLVFVLILTVALLNAFVFSKKKEKKQKAKWT